MLERAFTIWPYDIDAMRHVNNMVYIRWMEDLRCSVLDALHMPIHELANAGYGPVLIATEVRYLKPLVLGDTVKGQVWATELGAATMEMGFRFIRGDDVVVCEASQRGVFVDFASGRPRRLTSDQRENFAKLLEPPK